MLGLIFTYALTFGGATVALFNPFVGLLVYICFAIISPPSMWSWAVGDEGHFSRIVAIAMLIGWLFRGFGQWSFSRSRGVFLAFSGLFLWAMLSAFVAPNQEVAWNFVEHLAKIFIPFVVGLTLIDSLPKLKQLAWVIVGSMGYVALVMNLSYYQGFNRARLMGFGGLDNNSLAIAMVAGVGLAFFLGVGVSKWWQRVASWACALLMAHTVLFTFSRGGMLALIVSLVASFGLLPPKKPKHILALVACILIALRLAGPEVTDRFLSTFSSHEERDRSAQSRLEMWEDMWDCTLKNPILGVGPDHWPLTAPQYGWILGREGHSLWLQTAAELGIPGFIFLVCFYIFCVFKLWPIVRSRDKDLDPWYPNFGRMVIAAHAGFIISAQFVSLEALELPYYINLLGAGVLRLVWQTPDASFSARSVRPWARLRELSPATMLHSSKG